MARSEIRTRDLKVTSPKLYHQTTYTQQIIQTEKHSLMTRTLKAITRVAQHLLQQTSCRQFLVSESEERKVHWATIQQDLNIRVTKSLGDV